MNTEDIQIARRNAVRSNFTLSTVRYVESDRRDANNMLGLVKLHTIAPDTAYEHNRDNANVTGDAELDAELSK